ncbi:hypothetical protein HY637_03585 [Candidatus Woesearchaeota archaeon]|nr:hypothetical protein [Candidatus Woesearchaeota archaeon]
MTIRIGFVALGGHIITQNITFRTIIEGLGTKDYEFFGLEDGFKAFESGIMHSLGLESFLDSYGQIVPGFVSGASRYSLLNELTDELDTAKIQQAVNFIKAANLEGTEEILL